MGHRILVKYGAHLSRITKKEEEWIASESELSVEALLARLSEAYRGFSGSPSLENRFLFLITVNGEFVPASDLGGVTLRDGDTVTLFPPVSGG